MLKKIITASLTLVLTAALTGCGSSPTASSASNATASKAKVDSTAAFAPLQGKKILIAYFSYSNNTRLTAEMLQTKVGGDLFAIEPAEPYTTDYRALSAQAQEDVRNGYRPALKNKVTNIADYDVIFLGSPVWWYTIAPPVATFLSEHDLTNKTVVPFSTHAGYGAGRSFSDVAKAAPAARVLDGLALDRRSVPDATFLNGDGKNVLPDQSELQKYPAADTEMDNWLKKLQF